MRWLVGLVTRPGHVVLDPFGGTMTTGCAAVLSGRSFVGIEQDGEYFEVGAARLAHWARVARSSEGKKGPEQIRLAL